MKKKRILFLSLTITTGGAERTLFNILKYLDRERFEPFIAYFDKRPGQSSEIPHDVPLFLVQKKGIPGFIRIILTLAFRLYPKIRPDIVVGFLDFPNIAALLAKILSPKKHRVILTVHNNLKMLYLDKGVSAWLTRIVKLLYPKADKIIAVSKGVMNDLSRTFRIPLKKLTYIYNGIDIQFVKKKAGESPGMQFPHKEGKTIISCGRLDAQKNFTFLLHAFSIVIYQIPSHLCIIGEGSMKEELEQLARRLDIADHLTFTGHMENPFACIARSDLFVLSSSYEGLGNVLIEAMICGVPVISADCPFGPDEIIEHNKNGLLVPCEPLKHRNPVSHQQREPLTMEALIMAKNMYRVLSDPAFGRQLALEAEKRVHLFSAETMAGQYEKVFLEKK